jgi:hypothetical protein
MRSRPETSFQRPRRVFAGETFEVTLGVTSRSVTPIDFIDLHFFVTNGLCDPRQSSMFDQHELFHSTVRLAKKRELQVRDYRFRAAIEVPATLPPTYLGTTVELRAWIQIRIAIPWWLDVDERYDVTIAPSPVPRPAPRPIAGSSLRGNEPFVEVSLRAQSFAPGDVIEGAIAFGNLGGADVEFVEPALVGYEKFVGTSYAPNQGGLESHRHTAFLAVTKARQGREIPFRVLVPASAPTTASFPRGELRWVFEVRLLVKGGPSVVHRTPVTIAAFEGRALTAGAEAPQIGAGRWRAVWAEAAAAVGLALDPKALRLTGALSGCTVRVSVGGNDAKRSFLVAHLRWPSWCLDLAISGGGNPVRGAQASAQAFERRFQIAGRDLEQVRHMLRPSLRASLLVFHEVTLGDDEVEVHADAPGHDQPWIGKFLDDVVALASAVDEVSRQIPPPPAMNDFVPAWRRFAGDLDADLTVGNMAITGGEFEGAIFEIRTEIEGRTPEATTIELVIDPPLDAAVDLESPEAVQRLSPSIHEMLTSIAALCRPWLGADATRRRSLEVREALIAMRLPVVIADPAALRDLMGALLSLASLLRGDRRAGPYR